MKQKRYKREERVFYFKNFIEVERVYRGKGGARGRPRKERKKATPEQIEKQNRYNREKNLRRIMAANFKEDDHWVLLTYKKGHRTDRKAAKKDFRKFYLELGKEYKKRGQELKWIVRTEVGARGAAHHHLLLNRIKDSDILIKKCWKKIEGAGFTSYRLTYEEGGFKNLAWYMAKPEEEGKVGKAEEKSPYSRSRNMMIPEPEIKRAKAKEMREYPVPLPGYYIDSESVTMGINPYTGQEYQYFTMYRLDNQGREEGKSRKGEGG